jgi:hypothetical protein
MLSMKPACREARFKAPGRFLERLIAFALQPRDQLTFFVGWGSSH